MPELAEETQVQKSEFRTTGAGRTLIVVPRMKRRNARERYPRFLGVGKIFIAFQSHGYSDFGFRWRLSLCRKSLDRWSNHAQHPSPAAHPHRRAQSNLRRHIQG